MPMASQVYTAAEWNTIAKAAAMEGCTVNDYIRLASFAMADARLSDPTPPNPNPPPEPGEKPPPPARPAPKGKAKKDDKTRH